jgi:thymidylate synthase
MSRLFVDFPEAQNEITRDLAELGTDVHTETMQDKYIADDPDFMTKELTNYSYTVLKPNYTEIEGVHEDWVKQEWEDRLLGDLNPGRAWKLRREVWDQFRENIRSYGTFSYTYSARMGGKHIDKLIEELQRHPNSRQLWLPVWHLQDEDRRGERRVPCSLGYWLVQRKGALHLTYMMRSCDFYTHYANDVALATILLHYVAKQTDFKVGTFTHFLGSLHVYAKDVAHVF